MRRKSHEVNNQIILLQIFLDWNDGWLQVMAQSERLSESKRIVEVVAIYSISVCKFKPWNRIDCTSSKCALNLYFFGFFFFFVPFFIYFDSRSWFYYCSILASITIKLVPMWMAFINEIRNENVSLFCILFCCYLDYI